MANLPRGLFAQKLWACLLIKTSLSDSYPLLKTASSNVLCVFVTILFGFVIFLFTIGNKKQTTVRYFYCSSAKLKGILRSWT